MMRIRFALVFLLLAGVAPANEDLPLPQTSALLTIALPKPYKQAVLRAASKYDSAEDVTVLDTLGIRVGSEEATIPANVLALFEGPRLDTLRLFICPEFMLKPDDLPPKEQSFFAITFRFGARASEGDSLEDRPTAWIAVKHGKIRDIWVVKDIRKSTVPTKVYDIKTLKPVAPKR